MKLRKVTENIVWECGGCGKLNLNLIFQPTPVPSSKLIRFFSSGFQRTPRFYSIGNAVSVGKSVRISVRGQPIVSKLARSVNANKRTESNNAKQFKKSRIGVSQIPASAQSGVSYSVARGGLQFLQAAIGASPLCP
jgi:hypothetical protein